jgi:hypothetical protein
MDGAAVPVAEHLDFHVARIHKVFFEIQRVIAKCRLGLRAGADQRCRKLFRSMRYMHAAAAAAGGSFHENREADRMRKFRCFLVGRDAVIRPRDHRNSQSLGGALGLDLIAHQPDVRRLRTDKADIVLGENLREAGILGKKAIARVHGVGAGDFASGKQGRNIQVAVARRGRADAHALIGKAHMHRVLVGGGMHGDRRNAQLLARAQHAQGDLTAICDQNFVEHRCGFALI